MSSDYGGDYNSTGESSLPIPNVPDSTGGEGSSTARGSTQPAGMSAFFPSLQENPPQPAPSQQQKSNDSNEKGGRGGGRGGRGGFPRDANGVPNAPDDWTCSSCQNKNYARRQACNRCKAPKPGTRSEETRKYPPGPLSKEAVTKSNGRYHEGDWACAKCCNINWAKRQVCNSCGQSKPTDEGPREGRGGGFNEREEVKYKSSRYQDDGDKYDDMGRLKKQYRSGARSNGGDRPSSPGRDRRRSRSRSRSPRGDYRRSRSPRSRSPPRHRSRSPPRDRDRDRDRSRSPYERRYYRRSRSRSPRSYDRDYDRRRDYRPRSRSPRRDDYRRSPPRRRSRSRSYERR